MNSTNITFTYGIPECIKVCVTNINLYYLPLKTQRSCHHLEGIRVGMMDGVGSGVAVAAAPRRK